jgi:hypothetical protein
MEIYLVFGEIDGFGNDVFLSGVAKTEEEAKEILERTFFYGEIYIELSKVKQRKYQLIQPIKEEDIPNIENGGIYKINI